MASFATLSSTGAGVYNDVFTQTFNNSFGNGIDIRCTRHTPIDPSNVILTKTEIFGTGNAPTPIQAGATTFTGSTTNVRGDAFYFDYNTTVGTLYAGTDGLVIDGVKPSTIPGYSAAHNYTITSVVGTGSTMDFKFNDSDLTDNSNSNIKIVIKGPNMGATA
jgi:hypothetical protein